MVISPPPDAQGVAAGSPASALEGTTVGSTLPLFKTSPPMLGLNPPAAGVKVPINTVDLFTGKPIGVMSPSKTYKGYTIGFCCANSAGLNGGWDSLTEAEKDTYVRNFLK
jgi:hypothetical protein